MLVKGATGITNKLPKPNINLCGDEMSTGTKNPKSGISNFPYLISSTLWTDYEYHLIHLWISLINLFPPIKYVRVNGHLSQIYYKMEFIYFQNRKMNLWYQKISVFCDIQKWFSNIGKSTLISKLWNWISDIRKLFFRYPKNIFQYQRKSHFQYQNTKIPISKNIFCCWAIIFWYLKIIISDIEKSVYRN